MMLIYGIHYNWSLNGETISFTDYIVKKFSEDTQFLPKGFVVFLILIHHAK